MEESISKKAWLISEEMGYGHQRTAFNLRNLAFKEIIQINNYKNIPLKDKIFWEINKESYYFVSKLTDIPIIGNFLFNIFLDRFQRIEDFYSDYKGKKNKNFQLNSNYFYIKLGFGKDLIQILKKENEKIPIISTFFMPAFLAEYHHYKGEIFCIICDTDISRSWAPFFPEKSKIKYFASTKRTAERLKRYGVKKENIYLTGYPLPPENLGDEKLTILKEDLKYRLLNLDPKRKFQKKYLPLIKKHLKELPKNPNHNLSLMLSIGGAGAQKKFAEKILESLRDQIENNSINLTLIAGNKQKVNQYFLKIIEFFNLKERLNKNLKIIYKEDINSFFAQFNQELRKTDILITKPSELSFYAGLGLPILILPPIGHHEVLNKNWLIRKGAGIEIEDLKYIKNWLEDFLNAGLFFKAAISGFLEIRKLGTFKITKIIQNL